MSDIVSFESRRWREKADPKDHDPLTALREAIRQIETKEIEAEHVIVLHGRYESDGTSAVGYLQAGSFRELEQCGMLARGYAIISAPDR